jgi:predicted RNA-binding protein with PUA-like domain
MNFWILKSEADCYSIDDMKKDKRTAWTGVRNYQARNFIRQMQKGDMALFYHSSSEPNAVVGVVKITAAAKEDPTAFDAKDDHYDSKATKENPIWAAVEVSFYEKFKNPVTLSEIKMRPDLSGILLAQRGSRLSIMPLSKKHFDIIQKLGSKT